MWCGRGCDVVVTLEELAESIITRYEGKPLDRHDYQHELRKAGLREDDWRRLADLCDLELDARFSDQTFRS